MASVLPACDGLRHLRGQHRSEDRSRRGGLHQRASGRPQRAVQHHVEREGRAARPAEHDRDVELQRLVADDNAVHHRHLQQADHLHERGPQGGHAHGAGQGRRHRHPHLVLQGGGLDGPRDHSSPPEHRRAIRVLAEVHRRGGHRRGPRVVHLGRLPDPSQQLHAVLGLPARQRPQPEDLRLRLQGGRQGQRRPRPGRQPRLRGRQRGHLVQPGLDVRLVLHLQSRQWHGQLLLLLAVLRHRGGQLLAPQRHRAARGEQLHRREPRADAGGRRRGALLPAHHGGGHLLHRALQGRQRGRHQPGRHPRCLRREHHLGCRPTLSGRRRSHRA